MLYEKELLQKTFEDNAEGQSPEEFLKDRCKALLNLWIEQYNNGYVLYKYIGPFWEIMKEILEKYCPDDFLELEKMEGPFNNIEIVKNEFDYDSDLLNFMAGLQYADERQQAMHLPDEPHLIDIAGKDVQYLPNVGIVSSTGSVTNE